MFRKEEQAARRRIEGAERHRHAHCRRILLVKSTAILAQKYLLQNPNCCRIFIKPIVQFIIGLTDRKTQIRKYLLSIS